MDARTTVEQDDAMLQLLADAAPVPLGIPSWILKEMTTRVEFPVPPAEVLGLDGKEVSAEMLTEYKDKAGYQFSWGTVSESVSEVTGEEGTALCGAFEISPETILKALPRPDIFEDVMIAMYNQHPQANFRFECDEAYGSWYVMQFFAEGKREIAALRSWLAKTFIPKVLPDLLKSAEDLISLYRTDEERFYIQNVQWMIGEKDASDMHINAEKPVHGQESNATLH